MRNTIVILLAAALLIGCKGRPASSHLVRGIGSTTSPDGSLHLDVTKTEKSLIDFEVRDSATGKRLVKEALGSDAMRWFLHWETPTRLWAYASDTGYFKIFDFKPDGKVVETMVDRTTHVPQPVWENLPSSLQRKHKIQHDAAANGSS